MAKVIGVGGVFFKTKDPKALAQWYKDTLGLSLNDMGGADFIHGDSDAAFGLGARTIWAPFDADSDYFAPSSHDVMINLMVDDLDAVLAHAREAGAQIVGEVQRFEYGSFGWVMDPDGRKIELWQPTAMHVDGAQNGDA